MGVVGQPNLLQYYMGGGSTDTPQMYYVMYMKLNSPSYILLEDLGHGLTRRQEKTLTDVRSRAQRVLNTSTLLYYISWSFGYQNIDIDNIY